ncbi:hypothetical protein Pst134EB_006476 [Puccinia striiformis f. sp. tritici]|nr:hypothetical protein Pst134EB_006476 [Puccinia striiformis f. sp. tritici]
MAAPASSIVKSAQNASEIGWAFVPQYYTFVNKDPSRLHCFYTKRSTCVMVYIIDQPPNLPFLHLPVN